ncbi:MAG: hypothetical protein mread185_000682 [Mycoplasmataceae bacterium]|nr:MAG: hypothetical protein mread185_000682 [Mycoplasmataceae bacterium]
MSTNFYWIIGIIFCTIAGIVIGFFLSLWYMLRTLKKATGVKSWKEFLNQAKKAQEMQKKMEKGGINSILSDPQMRKQIEELQRRFKK